MNRSLNGVRERSTSAGTGSKNGEHSTTAPGVHGSEHDYVANARSDRQLERFFRSLRKQPSDEDGSDTEDRRELCRECQREKSSCEIDKPAPEIRGSTDQNTPEIRGRSETVALGSEQRLLR